MDDEKMEFVERYLDETIGRGGAAWKADQELPGNPSDGIQNIFARVDSIDDLFRHMREDRLKITGPVLDPEDYRNDLGRRREVRFCLEATIVPLCTWHITNFRDSRVKQYQFDKTWYNATEEGESWLETMRNLGKYSKTWNKEV